MRADARPPALLASVPDALVRADARAPAVLALAPHALVRADAHAPAVLASASDALMRADARPPALLASAPLALVRADARPPALIALTPLAVVRAAAARLLARGASRSRRVPAPAPLSSAARGIRRRRLPTRSCRLTLRASRELRRSRTSARPPLRAPPPQGRGGPPPPCRVRADCHIILPFFFCRCSFLGTSDGGVGQDPRMQHMSRFGGVAPVNHQMPHAGGATAFDMRMAHAPVRLILFADTPVAPCISTCSWASAVPGCPRPHAPHGCAHTFL